MNRLVYEYNEEKTELKYSNKKDNTLSQIKRIFYYLFGKNKSYSFTEMMKTKYPEANKNGKWCFNKEDIWKELLNNKELFQKITNKEIQNYYQLVEKTEEYCEKYDVIL